VPGRLNEGWFLVEKEGVYYGQCSEICGIDHAFMPIEVRVVSQAAFDRWAELMKAGDYDAAAASVRQVAALESETKFASSN
jgi:cytochrome c oxidase subunit 2